MLIKKKIVGAEFPDAPCTCGNLDCQICHPCDPCGDPAMSDLYGIDDPRVNDYFKVLRSFSYTDECGVDKIRCVSMNLTQDSFRSVLTEYGASAVDNGDGTITITNPDGSQVTFNEAGLPPEWGSITGDIANQTDLYAVLTAQSDAITANQTNISNNAVEISDNANAIAANALNISNNSDAIAINQAAILDRMRWMGEWSLGSYEKNDVVRDGQWTMVANKATTDPAAPQPQEPAFYLYDGADPTATPNALQVINGAQYGHPTQAFYVDGYRIYAVAGNVYQIVIVRDPGGSNDTESLGTLEPTQTGWVEISIAPRLVNAGVEFQLLALIRGTAAGSGSLSLTYDYIPYSDDPPAAGEIRQSNYPNDILRVSKTDAVATPGASAQVSGMTLGDSILVSATGTEWVVQTAVDMGDYMEFMVSPGQTIAGGGGPAQYSILFTSEATQGILILEDTDYWLTSEFAGLVQGVYGEDVPVSGVALNDTAYGVDIRVQQANLSPDWDVVAVSGGSGSGSDARVNDLIALSGMPSGSTVLGAFTGVTIPDGSTNVEAFQALESAVEVALGGGITWATPVDANIVPDGNNTRNVGSPANQFQAVHSQSVLLDSLTITTDDGSNKDAFITYEDTDPSLRIAIFDNNPNPWAMVRLLHSAPSTSEVTLTAGVGTQRLSLTGNNLYITSVITTVTGNVDITGNLDLTGRINNIDIVDLQALTGLPSGSTSYPSFSGSIIPNSSNTEEALQALETAIGGAARIKKDQQLSTFASGSIVWDYSTADSGLRVETPTGAITIANPTNLPTLGASSFMDFLFTFTFTGGIPQTLTWGAMFENTPTLPADSAGLVHIAAVYDGTYIVLGSPVVVDV